jgi:hypothetical protein
LSRAGYRDAAAAWSLGARLSRHLVDDLERGKEDLVGHALVDARDLLEDGGDAAREQAGLGRRALERVALARAGATVHDRAHVEALPTAGGVRGAPVVGFLARRCSCVTAGSPGRQPRPVTSAGGSACHRACSVCEIIDRNPAIPQSRNPAIPQSSNQTAPHLQRLREHRPQSRNPAIPQSRNQTIKQSNNRAARTCSVCEIIGRTSSKTLAFSALGP